ncbi:hypothetical protein [uncultured Roseobacter sp.]|uniref:hypothetical protein n=1 Tax=uncultured Roseobacter sp. TaxID=114847 RepID=UPI00262A3EF7|nr:hypothetical protein [uncultured Roseobacter sp.]
MSQNLNEILGSIGGDLTSDKLTSAASSLPTGYVLTLTVAGEIGVGGVFGLEGAYTDVYSPNGTVNRIYTGAGTGGTPSPLPVEFVGELGLAYIGDSGIASLEGFSVTVEGGAVVGFGATVPLVGGVDYLENLVVAASSGDTGTMLNALSNAPEGSIVFVSSGVQASAGAEVSYSLLSGSNFQAIQTEFTDSEYWSGFNTAMDRRVPVDIIWQVDLGGGQMVTFSQRVLPGGDRRDGSAFDGSLREGVSFVITTTAVDQDGNRLSDNDLSALGMSPITTGVSWDRGINDSVGQTIEWKESCFAPEVPIDMWPLDPDFAPDPTNPQKQYDQQAVRVKVWTKPIEQIEVGDIVVSFDANGNLVPGPVTRTFQNDAKILLDFHGTRVTPGHIYFRPDSKKAHKYETLIDVLRDDGVIKHQDGTLIRAATNAPVGSPRDGFVRAITGTRKADGTVEQKDAGRIRLGTRVLVGSGQARKSWAVADLIEAGGGVVGDDELIRAGDGPAMPFHWEFGDTLPKPEDFVLACSGTTLEDIYKAAEWESQGPRLPAPMVLDRGPVQPLPGAALSVMPRNELLEVVHAPIVPAKPERALNRK